MYLFFRLPGCWGWGKQHFYFTTINMIFDKPELELMECILWKIKGVLRCSVIVEGSNESDSSNQENKCLCCVFCSLRGIKTVCFFTTGTTRRPWTQGRKGRSTFWPIFWVNSIVLKVQLWDWLSCFCCCDLANTNMKTRQTTSLWLALDGFSSCEQPSSHHSNRCLLFFS